LIIAITCAYGNSTISANIPCIACAIKVSIITDYAA
jgi:hypothetical protein